MQVFLSNFDFCITRYLFKKWFEAVFYFSSRNKSSQNYSWFTLLGDIGKLDQN